MRPILGLVAAAAIGMPVAPASAPASSASYSFVVTSTADTHDASPGDGRCADAKGACTLRAAVEEASALPGPSSISITVPAGHYKLSLGSLAVTANTVRVTGGGAGLTVVDGGGRSRVLLVGAASVTLNGLTITGGNAGAGGYGGGVYNRGRLTVANSVVSHNTAAAGGGLANAGGQLAVDNTVVTANTATGYGGGGIQNGGLQNVAGKVTVVNSRVAGNIGGGDGAGILNGQNGHPASGVLPAVPVRRLCPPRAQCPAGALPAIRGLHQASTGQRVVTIVGSIIAGNQGDNGGGGLANDLSTMVVVGSRVDDNSSPAAIGGGISSDGNMSITRTEFNGNVSTYGGALEVFSSSVTVTDSTFASNTASSFGGAIDLSAAAGVVNGTTMAQNAAGGGAAIEVEGSSELTLQNSTVNANHASVSGAGAGIDTFGCGSAVLSYVTFADNSVAISASCPDVFLTGTLLAASGTGANCHGSISETAGYNLDSGTSCHLAKPTDLSSKNPLLGPLANNGGPTQTRSLLTGSPAIDTGGTLSTGCPLLDQRGDLRNWFGTCDIGAYEVQG